MAYTAYSDTKYTVKKNQYDFILRNNLGEYENHGHFKKFSTCMLLIRLMENDIVPESNYLRKAVLRISIDDKYLEKVQIKMNKQKKKYININKGIIRK